MRTPLRQRLLAKMIVMPSGCVEWAGSRYTLGYGIAHDGGRRHLAHRLVYTVFVGPIPEGLVLDHLCKNPPCVHPGHLEPVTQGENVRRGESPSARRARQVLCHRGHELTPSTQGRACRTCHRERERTARAAGRRPETRVWADRKVRAS